MCNMEINPHTVQGQPMSTHFHAQHYTTSQHYIHIKALQLIIITTEKSRSSQISKWSKKKKQPTPEIKQQIEKKLPTFPSYQH